MDRTVRAALLAVLIGVAGIGGIAWFLGVPSGSALVAGLVAGAAFGGLILLAARRADSLAPPPGPGSPPRTPPDDDRP